VAVSDPRRDQAVHIRAQADRLCISADRLTQLLVAVTLTNRTLGAARTTEKDANTVGFIAVGSCTSRSTADLGRSHCATHDAQPGAR
jgi:hypothetical protein